MGSAKSFGPAIFPFHPPPPFPPSLSLSDHSVRTEMPQFCAHARNFSPLDFSPPPTPQKNRKGGRVSASEDSPWIRLCCGGNCMKGSLSRSRFNQRPRCLTIADMESPHTHLPPPFHPHHPSACTSSSHFDH